MIKVYTTYSCPYCTRAKNYLDLHGIEYETLNIQEDNQARDFFIKTGYRTVPQMFVGCLLYTSPSPRDLSTSRMPSSA